MSEEDCPVAWIPPCQYYILWRKGEEILGKISPKET